MGRLLWRKSGRRKTGDEAGEDLGNVA